MKRIGLSLVLSLGVILAWTITGGVLYAIFPDSKEVELVAVPLDFFPDLIFFNLIDSDYHPDYPLGAVLAGAVDLFIFAIPIYGVLTILAKRKPTVVSPDPPPPPTFER